MPNRKCKNCQQACQQSEFVTVVACPFFEPKMSAHEMMAEIDRVDEEMSALQARLARLMARVQKRENAGDEI